VRIAAEVNDCDPVRLFGRRQAWRNDLFTLFALEADRQAVVIADGLRGLNMALVSACATGSSAIGEAAEVFQRGAANMSERCPPYSTTKNPGSERSQNSKEEAKP